MHIGSTSEGTSERQIKITLQPEAASMVDVVVLSFIVFEVVRRERGEAKNWGAFWGAQVPGAWPRLPFRSDILCGIIQQVTTVVNAVGGLVAVA